MKLRAILGLKTEFLFTLSDGIQRMAVFLQIKLEKRRMAKRPLAVGSPFRVHLENTQIDAKLNFLLPILAHESPNYNLARLVIPLLEQVRDVEIHVTNMNRTPLQVNVRGRE